MSQQFFEVSKGILIDETVAIITGTGEAGSGINDGAANEAAVGTLYLRSQEGSVKFYQKIADGVGTDKWEGLASAADISDIDNIRASLGTLAGDLTLGIMSGGVIADNSTVKSALEQLTAYVEQTRSLTEKLEFSNSVIDRIDAVNIPSSPAQGDRYLIITGDENFNADSIYEFDGSAWVEETPSVGTLLSVDDEPTVMYQFGSTGWVSKSFENTTAGNGLVKNGTQIGLSSGIAGAGLSMVQDYVLNLSYDSENFEINDIDQLRVKDGGIGAQQLAFNSVGINALNLGTGDDQFNAFYLPLASDTATLTGYYSVNTAIESIYNTLQTANTGIANNAADIATLQSDLSSLSTTVSDLSTEVSQIDSRVNALENATSQTNKLNNPADIAVNAANVNTNVVVAVTWHVLVEDLVTGDREFFQVSAVHNGSGGTAGDATEVKYNLYGKLRLDNVSGDDVDVIINGSGKSQEMRLMVKANNNFDVRVLKAEEVTH